jgi:serine/threonine protein kinase
MHESFPFFPDPKRRHEVLYCLVSELVESGTLHDHLASTRRPWTQKRAVQEIIALLKLLDQLHGAGALHRDITPMNVFLCENRRLKLGDFGIAKQVLAGRAATATAFNPSFVSNRMALGVQRYWLASDDVYQMGQLLGMLLRGDPHTLICEKDIRSLACDEYLKRILVKAICPRKSRYPDAREMLRALQGDGDHIQPPLASLAGKTVVFTGPLSIRRFDAGVMVRQAGGSVAEEVTKRVDVVVQGGRSPLYRNGHKGDKLCQAEKLIRQGHPICIINEREFGELVGL